jgi:uncharacterized protein
MSGTKEGGVKAAETRKEHDPDAFKKMGHLGGEARKEHHSSEELSEQAKRFAETRKEHDPDAFKKMGHLGGKAKKTNDNGENE